MAEYGLGRIYRPDERDWSVRQLRLYISTVIPRRSLARRLWDLLVARFCPPPDAPPWDDPIVLDQGSTGTCLPAGSLVRMADNSLVPIEEIRTRDVVRTAEGNIGRVTRTFVRTSDHLNRVWLWGHRGLFAATDEHPVLTERGYVPVRSLTTDDWVAIPSIADEDDDELIVPLTEKERQGRVGVRAYAGFNGHTRVTLTVAPDRIEKSVAFGRLLGLYLAEGSVSPSGVLWTFGKHECDTLAAETVILIRNVLGAEARIQPRPNNSVNVRLYGKAWALMFDRLGGSGAANKHLSPEVASGPRDYRRAILEGWLDGDGHSRRGGHQGVTVSRHLALDMFGIAESLGMHPNIRRSQGRPGWGVLSRRDRYDIEWSDRPADPRFARQHDSTTWRRVRGIERVPFSGDVFNIEVEGDNSYIADGIAVHNCVGHGWAGWLAAAPVQDQDVTEELARAIYLEATCLAGRCDETLQVGCTVRDGAKAVMRRGRLTAYGWASTTAEMIAWLRDRGPIVMGTNWYTEMFEPRDGGLVRVAGDVAGGHCYLCIDYEPDSDTFLFVNSWGREWGEDGRFRMRASDVARLLREQGEACCAVELPLA